MLDLFVFLVMLFFMVLVPIIILTGLLISVFNFPTLFVVIILFMLLTVL